MIVDTLKRFFSLSKPTEEGLAMWKQLKENPEDLSIDTVRLRLCQTEEEKHKYLNELMRRRERAYERDKIKYEQYDPNYK